MAHSSAQTHTLPAVHVQHLLEILPRWGVGADDLLADAEVSAADLAVPGARVPLATLCDIVTRAVQLTGEPALGVYAGLNMKVSWHGFLGFAAMCAPTVRDAIELACEFAPTRTSALGLRLEQQGEHAALIIDEHASLGAAREPVIIALVIGVWQIGNELAGRMLAGEARFAFAEPPYFQRFRQLGAHVVRFDCADHRMVFERSLLDVPLRRADVGALTLARSQCEQELSAVRGDDAIVGRVRALLHTETHAPRSVGEVAEALAMSPRTLKRKLSAFATSFSQLLAEENQRVASELLRSGASVDEVAERLGYADPRGFARAYRRWTGMTPSAYRRLIGAGR